MSYANKSTIHGDEVSTQNCSIAARNRKKRTHENCKQRRLLGYQGTPSKRLQGPPRQEINYFSSFLRMLIQRWGRPLTGWWHRATVSPPCAPRAPARKIRAILAFAYFVFYWRNQDTPLPVFLHLLLFLTPLLLSAAVYL
jgi:hypothetical protein